MNIRIATRGSRLALRQSEIVCQKLRALDPAIHCELVIVRTAGDRNQRDPLYALGGKGIFVKEIETYLMTGRADLAVHSMKDLPSAQPAGFVLRMPGKEKIPVTRSCCAKGSASSSCVRVLVSSAPAACAAWHS